MTPAEPDYGKRLSVQLSYQLLFISFFFVGVDFIRKTIYYHCCRQDKSRDSLL